MREFGRVEYDDAIYVNFDSNSRLDALFAGDLASSRILAGLELYAGRRIVPGRTLIIFDEIQQVPRAMTSLKYFYEDAPEHHVICAGSMLGVAMHSGEQFPVGKVDFLRVGPMTFLEYLTATGRERLAQLAESGDFDMMAAFSAELADALRGYYIVGGMPEAVLAIAEGGTFDDARAIQRSILESYEHDLSRHAPPSDVPRIRAVWSGVPAMLARENKKFVYGVLRDGARAREYERAIMWLVDCGLVRKITRASTPSLPLKAFEDARAFKLYLVDVGLLSCMCGIAPIALLDGASGFGQFKGAITEQYAVQQVAATCDMAMHYYTNDRGSCEIDLLLDDGRRVVPVEIKAERDLRAKSLAAYRQKFSPEIALRVSMSDGRREPGITDLPLYAIGRIADECRITSP